MYQHQGLCKQTNVCNVIGETILDFCEKCMYICVGGWTLQSGWGPRPIERWGAVSKQKKWNRSPNILTTIKSAPPPRQNLVNASPISRPCPWPHCNSSYLQFTQIVASSLTDWRIQFNGSTCVTHLCGANLLWNSNFLFWHCFWLQSIEL
jgi:hypothetical protein